MCEICGKVGGHWPRCPHYKSNYEKEPTAFVCVICGEKIYADEDILCNGDDVFHRDCFLSAEKEELIEKLSFEKVDYLYY